MTLVPVTNKIWESSSNDEPLFIARLEPRALLASELKRTVPELFATMRVELRMLLVRFERGGLSSTPYVRVHAARGDALTRKKGTTDDIEEITFIEVLHIDEHRTTSIWPWVLAPWWRC